LAIQTKNLKPSLVIWFNLRINNWQFKHMGIVRIGAKSIEEVEKSKQCAILKR
jgi:hypothetical protein